MTCDQEHGYNVLYNNQILNDQFIWVRRKELTGCEIRMAYLQVENNSFYEKYEVPYLKMLLNKLNFSVTYLLSEENNYGVFDTKTRKWNGLVGCGHGIEFSHLSMVLC